MVLAVVEAAAAAVVVWGPDLLRCGSDVAEELAVVLRAG